MNCTNCGAPAELAEGRSHFYCHFCSTLTFPNVDESQQSEDRVTALGHDTDWDCPVCHGMLEHASVEECRVHYCGECRGMLVNSETFAAVVRIRRARFSEPDHEPIPLNPDDLARSIRCPSCHLPMDAHPYYGPGNVVIDSCHRCQVIWLDRCELATIESAPGQR